MPGYVPTPPDLRDYSGVLNDILTKALADTTTDPAAPAASQVVPSPASPAESQITSLLQGAGATVSPVDGINQHVSDYVSEGVGLVPPQSAANQPLLTLSTVLSPAGPNAGPILAEAIDFMKSVYGEDVSNRLRLELLPPDQRAAVVAQLTSLKDMFPQIANFLEGAVPDKQLQQLTNAAALLAGGDYSKILSPEMVATIQKQAQDYMNQTVRTGSFNVDVDFARAHPLQAIAMAKLAESYGVPVKIGDNSFWGQMKSTPGGVLEGVLTTVDVGQSGLSVMARYATHGLSELGENVNQAVGLQMSEAEALKVQDVLRKSIADGTIPQDQLNDAYLLLRIADDVTSPAPNPVQLSQEVLNPVQRGNSLAEQVFRGSGTTPEDPSWTWGTNVLGGIIAFTRLDPINALGMVSRGAKLATEFALPDVLRYGSAQELLDAGFGGVKTLEQADSMLVAARQYVVGLTHNSLTRKAYMTNAMTAGEWANKAVVSPGGRVVVPAVEWANQTYVGMSAAADRAGWLADNLPGMFSREDISLLSNATGPGQLLDYVTEGLGGIRTPERVAQLTEDLSRVSEKIDRYNYLSGLEKPLRGNSAVEFTALERQLPELFQEQLTLQRSLRAGHDMTSLLSQFPKTQMSGVFRGAFPEALSTWEQGLTDFYGGSPIGKTLHKFVENFPTGTIHNPAFNAVEGELSDFATQSLSKARDLLYRMDVPLVDRQRILGDYVRITDPGAFKVWVDDLTRTVADNLKDPEMAGLWRDYSKRVFEERVDSVVNKTDEIGFATHEPTGFQVKLDPDGTPIKSPIPVWPSDYLRGYDVPSPDMILESVSAKRRLLRQLGKSKAGAPLEKAVRSLIEFNNTVHYVWKTLVLGFKLPLSLTVRVAGEEQARIAAFGYASAVDNPIKWWAARKGLGEFAKFTGESTDEFLGLMMDQIGLRGGVKTGQYILKNTDSRYFDAVAGLMAHRNTDPLARQLLANASNEPVLAWLGREDNALGRAWLRNAELTPFTPDQLLTRMRSELADLTGGDPALAEAVIRGKIKVGDNMVEVGSHESSDYLRTLAENGEYTGPRFVPGHKIDILPSKVAAGRQFRDWWFNKFFSQPDLNWSRRPLFRQVADREYNRLIALGYTEKAALRGAEAYGARQTADLLYDLGIRTSAQHFAKNITPFGAAFQELINTWFLRIPGRMGMGIGHAVLARKASALMNALDATGFVAVDPRTGQKFLTFPPLNELYRALTGTEAPAIIGFNVSSFNMVTNNMLPGLGPVTSMALGQLSNRVNALSDAFDMILPYGSDTAVGPTAINNLWIAATSVLGEPTPPPWELTTWSYQRMMINSALDDAARQVRMEMGPPPDPASYPDTKKGQTDYQTAAQEWRDTMVRSTEKKGAVQYMLRGLAAMVLPAPPQFTDQYELNMANIWKEVSVFPSGDENKSEVLRAFNNEYPDASWYPVGKTFGVPRNVTNWDDWLQAYREGKIKSLDYRDYINFAAGQESYRAYINIQADNIKQIEGGGGAPALLLNWHDRQQEIQNMRDEFDRYLAWNPEYARLHDEMISAQTANSLEDGAVEHQTLQIQRLLELQRLMTELEGSFTTNGLKGADFQSIVGKIRELTDGVTYGPATSQVSKNLDWYWTNVGVPYYKEVGRLYDEAFNLPEADRGPIFDQIRQLKDSLEPQTHRGQAYPTPEQVGYASLSNQGQEQKRLEWMTRPLEWLSSFERKTIGLPSGPEVDQYFNAADSLDQKFRDWAAASMVSPSSTAYQAQKTAVEQEKQKIAKQLGVSDVYAMTQAPIYQRLGTLGFTTNATFAQISDEADAIWRQYTAAGVSPGGSTASARAAQTWLFAAIQRGRAADPEFDKLMSSLEYAMAPSGQERLVGSDMYMRVFFDYFGPVPQF